MVVLIGASMTFSQPARADVWGAVDAAILKQQIKQYFQDWKMHIIDDHKNNTRNKTLKDLKKSLIKQNQLISKIVNVLKRESSLYKYFKPCTDMLYLQNDFGEMMAPFQYCNNVKISRLASELTESLSYVNEMVMDESIESLKDLTELLGRSRTQQTQATSYDAQRLINDRLEDAYGYMNDLSLKYQDILVEAVYDDFNARSRQANANMNFANFN